MVKPNRNLKLKLDGNELDLSFSELKEVPIKELAQLPKATHLDLSCNKIVTLQPSFCTLTHLVKLDLSKNQIKELPSNFGLLENLHTLDLYSNEIEVLPPSFSQLKKLKWLDLKNNPLKPQLKEVAGDCLDPVQCQLCAKNVVKFMGEVCIQLEKERQQRLQEEKEKEEARKLAEEKEKEKQRLAKKAAKKKRNAELKAKQGQSEDENQVTNVNQTEEPIANHFPELPVKKQSECKQTMINLVVWTFTIFGLFLTIGLAVLWHYTQWDLSEERWRLAEIQLQQDTDYFLRKCSDITDIVVDVVKRSTEKTLTLTYNYYNQARQWFEDQPPSVTEETDSATPEATPVIM